MRQHVQEDLVAIKAGTRLGAYEIISTAGSGGMGDVYKAMDTRLNRTVAIKVLRRGVATTELRSRLQREAQMIASLNHPHICVLHDVGQQDGTDYLVMEYLDGETLAARLSRGPLPWDQALEFTIQIADALDKAHRQDVVHRDLKPGNIMLTKSGAKVLDFGLAKLSQRTPVTAASDTALPTARPATPITAEGTILGTLHYMSPEQLEGNEADARSDIFAFGAVLYEMVAGAKAFDGQSPASLIGAIMEREPAREPLMGKNTPPGLERTLRKCLEKDPTKRWQSAGDLRDQLTWIRVHPEPAPVQTAVSNRRRESLAWSVAVLLALLVAMLGYRILHPPEVDQPMVRFGVEPPPDAPFPATVNAGPAVSFDGGQIAFGAGGKLWIRNLNTMDSRALPGTEIGTLGVAPLLPFWSPDGRYLAYSQGDKLLKIDVTGGPPQTLWTSPSAFGFNGGAWSPDGKSILFAGGTLPEASIFIIPSGGGEPRVVAAPKAGGIVKSFGLPIFLPDGKQFLCIARPGSSVFLASVDGGIPVEVLKADSKVEFVQPGYLLFLRGQTLLVQSFDPSKRIVRGDATPIAEQIGVNSASGRANFSASWNGVLAFRSGAANTKRELVWYDRNGKETGKVGDPGDYRGVALSPDGTRLAVHIHDDRSQGGVLWMLDLIRAGTSRFSFKQQHSTDPIWSPDGKEVAYDFLTDAGWQIYRKLSNGTSEEKLMFKSDNEKDTFDWSSDGQYILYGENNPATRWDLWILPLTGDQKPIAFANSSYNETRAKFSPDRRWVAYDSDETGRAEVYIQPFDRSGGKYQVSTTGGSQALWNKNGKEIFFTDPNGNVMAAGVTVTGNALHVDVPKLLFKTRPAFSPNIYNWDVSADGQHFVITSLPQTDVGKSAPISVVLNWPKMLKH
jgi:serine/threonine protein kinase/Tol biopolymer transport system component